MRIRRPGRDALVAAFLMLAQGAPGVAAPPDPGARALIYAEIVLNGLHAGTFMLVRRGNGFFLRPDALRDLSIAMPPGATVRIEAEDFVPLSALPGAVVRFDEARQELWLDVGAGQFAATRLSAAARPVHASKAARAVFVNYDLNIEQDRRVVAGGLIETGVSDDWGLAVNTMTVGRAGGGSGVTRLDTFVVRDNPERLSRLVVGDTLTAPTDGLPPMRFGGIRLGTAFDLRPGLITFPTPAFTGLTANPSQVELLVNGALAYRANVARGPFAIEQVPVVTGAGQATLVVRDVLGVERSVTSSYYTNPGLLRTGLAEWSVEAGAPRQDYGTRSFSYGAPFGAASYRRGLSDTVTVAGRVEVSKSVRMAGGGVALVWPKLGEFGVTGGVSDSEAGRGGFYTLSFRRVSRSWSLTAARRRATARFASLGAPADTTARTSLTDQLQLSASASMGHMGNIGMSFSALTYADDRRATLATASYGIDVGPRGYVNAFAVRTTSHDRPNDLTFGASLSLSLGPRISMFAQADSHGAWADLRRTPDYGGGFGYRLGISRAENQREQAELSWRGKGIEGRVEAVATGDRLATRVQVGGGILLAGDSLVATRRIEDGLAVVEVSGAAGIRIYQDNRLVARTDAHGRATVPNLRPYQPNRISLDATDLPLGTRLPHTTLVVVPRFRGAVHADFETSTAMPVTLIVEQPNGNLLEAGATVAMGDGSATFVGFGGEVFVNDARPGLTITAETATGPCTLILGRDMSLGMLARIGPLRCRFDGTSS